MMGAINDAIWEVIKEVIREAIREVIKEVINDMCSRDWISRLDLEIGSREVAHSSSIIIRHHHGSLPQRNWDVCCHPTRPHRSPRSELAMVRSRPW